MSRPAWRGFRPTSNRWRQASARGRPTGSGIVTLPLLAPYLVAAFGLSFALSMGELGATVMVYPPGWVTLPVSIFSLTDRGEIFAGAALTMILVAATLVLLLVGLERMPLGRGRTQRKELLESTCSGPVTF